MKLFVKPIEKAKVDEIKKIFFRYEAKGDMIQRVLSNQQDGTNTEMFKIYNESYEEAAAEYKEKFMEFTAMIPDGVEMQHEIRISVSFIHQRLELQQLCDCDIDEIMEAAGFERIN